MSSFKDCWDQRIRNEPIMARNFFLAQPPIVPYERPVSTLGTKTAPVGMVNAAARLSYNSRDEQRLANYWLASKNHEGIITSDYDLNQANLPMLQAKYPQRPWIQGPFHNIAAETEVKPYQPIGARDCIPESSLAIIERQRLVAEARAKAREARLQLNPVAPVWDINTSFKLMQRPNKN